MQKIAKGIFTALTALGMVLYTPVAALAVTNSTSIVNSGDDTHVDTNATQTSTTDVTNVNTATVNQNVTSTANTGGNDANNNIGASSVTTGSTSASTSLSADLNHNVTAVDPATGADPNTTSAVNTGDDLHLNTSTLQNTAVNVTNTNVLDLLQSLYSTADTGNNDANNNIGGGTVSTGSTSVGALFDAAANHNTTAVGGAGAAASPLTNSTAVTNTGDDVHVDTNATSNTSAYVTNVNTALLSQLATLTDNTGWNDANNNIGGGLVLTGGTNSASVFSASGNDNITGIAFGPLSLATNTSSTVNTGDDLHVNASVLSTLLTNTVNVNDAYLSQLATHTSDTGNNDANNNIGTGGVDTAGTLAGTSFSALGGSNTTLLGPLAGLLGLLGL